MFITYLKRTMGFVLFFLMMTAGGDWWGKTFVSERGSRSFNREVFAEVDTAQGRAQVSDELRAQVFEKLRQTNFDIPHQRDAFRDFFKARGSEALPLLKEALTDEKREIRENAIEALNVLTKPKEYRDETYVVLEKKLIPLFIQGLDDKEAGIRRRALALLRSVAISQMPTPEPEIVGAMKKMLDDSDASIQELAAVYLISIGEESTIPSELYERLHRKKE
jgi:HEAT repeat protein